MKKHSLKKMALEAVPDMIHMHALRSSMAVLEVAKAARGAGAENHPTLSKYLALRLTQSATVLALGEKDGPHFDKVCAALVGPMLDEIDFDGDDEEAMKRGEGIAGRMLTGAVSTFAELLPIYIHEHSHAAVGRSFGYAPTVHVQAGIEEINVEGKGTGLAVRVEGGSCRHATDEPIPNNHKAAISAAGLMGELSIPAYVRLLGDDDPEAAEAGGVMFRDAQFWGDMFGAAFDKAGKDGTPPSDAFQQSFGAESDAQDLYATAPTKPERSAAIKAAGKVLHAEAQAIFDKALADTLSHLTVLGVALKLRALAHVLSDAACNGDFAADRIAGMFGVRA